MTNLYLFDERTFQSLEEMNNKNLASFESYSIQTNWPQLKNGNMKIQSIFEVEQKPVFKGQVIFSNKNSHEAYIEIPAINLKARYQFFVQMEPTFEINYKHQIQMNAKKITKSIRSSGYKVNARSMDPLIASRNQMYHDFSVSFPSNRACSTYSQTPVQSLVTTFRMGTNKACFSGSQGHVAIKVTPDDESSRFEFFSGIDLDSEKAIWYLNSIPVKSEIIGQWDFDLSDQQISMGTSISLAGTAVETPIETQLEIIGQISGDDIRSRINGNFNNEAFTYELVGRVGQTEIAGTQQNSLTVNIPDDKNNVMGLKQIVVYLNADKYPVGISITQSDYLVQWLVDTQSHLVFLNIHNDDKVCLQIITLFAHNQVYSPSDLMLYF